MTSVNLAASGVGLLATIIAAPVALGLQAGVIVCGLLGGGGGGGGGLREIGRPEASNKGQET